MLPNLAKYLPFPLLVFAYLFVLEGGSDDKIEVSGWQVAVRR